LLLTDVFGSLTYRNVRSLMFLRIRSLTNWFLFAVSHDTYTVRHVGIFVDRYSDGQFVGFSTYRNVKILMFLRAIGLTNWSLSIVSCNTYKLYVYLQIDILTSISLTCRNINMPYGTFLRARSLTNWSLSIISHDTYNLYASSVLIF